MGFWWFGVEGFGFSGMGCWVLAFKVLLEVSRRALVRLPRRAFGDLVFIISEPPSLAPSRVLEGPNTSKVSFLSRTTSILGVLQVGRRQQ